MNSTRIKKKGGGRGEESEKRVIKTCSPQVFVDTFEKGIGKKKSQGIESLSCSLSPFKQSCGVDTIDLIR